MTCKGIMVTRLLPWFFLIFLSLYPGCQLKRGVTSHLPLANQDVPVFIEIPKNNLVFDSIATIVYDTLYAHFERIGYRPVSSPNDGYTLKIQIKGLNPSYKYISPDVLLFHSTMRLELHCQLLDYAKKLVTQKTFSFSTLISKPQNPILTSDFLDFEYTKLLEKSAPKIEHYFRPYLLKSVQ